MKNKLLCWDWDGTIVDSMGFVVEHFPKIFRDEFGIELEKNLVRRYYRNGFFGMLDALLKATKQNLDKAGKEKLWTKHFANITNSKQALLPNVRELLTEAKKRGIKNALTSNNEEKFLYTKIAQLDLEKYFDLTVGYESVKNKKPSSDMYVLACEKLDISHQEAVAIDDNLTGVQGAKRAEMAVLAVETGIYRERDFAPYAPTKVVKDLTAITLDEILAL